MKISRSRAAFAAVMMALAAALIPAGIRAQTNVTGEIAGATKDASGAAMPGVTVTIESPAMIEKSRVVVTDDHGEYKVQNLRPGIYSVTFSAQGFAVVKREGLELNTGITLPVDAVMQIGSVSQSITVTTATPVVDVENSNPENVLTAKELVTLPTGMATPGYAEITLGASQTGTQDVGGSQGEANVSIVIHDSRNLNDDALLDGMSWSNGGNTGGYGQRGYVTNKVSVQELTISTTGGSAEAGHPGANVNIVPKTGSNEFHGAFNATGASPQFQMGNLDAALVARGLTSTATIKELYDLGAGAGGPIIRDKLWFWIGLGAWNAEQYAPGNYFNKTQNTLFYTPDLSRPAYTMYPNFAADMRYDWQASKKNHFSVYQGAENTAYWYSGVTGNDRPEAASNDDNRASFLTQVAFDRTQTNKLLFRAGLTAALAPGRVNAYTPGVTPQDVPIYEEDTGYYYHAYYGESSLAYGKPIFDEYNGIATAQYVTGSHALKVGYQWQWTSQGFKENLNVVPGVGPVSYGFNQPAGDPNPVPYQITEYASPLAFNARSWTEAIYGEDQWTIRRLTLNLGLRYDWERGYTPEDKLAQSYFTPATVFPQINGTPDWNDIEPRVGAAYDLFGNGRTAVKGAIGRYVLGDYTTTTIANAPENAIVTSATRSWVMTAAEIAASGGDYVPNCNLTLTTANGDCGALSNNGFGTVSTNTTYDPAILSGWGVRPYNWQADVQIQQQIRPGMGVTASYYRTWYENFTVTENTAVPSTQYGTFCITGPSDPRLAALNGRTVCGFHDVNPGYYGKTQNLVTKASNFGGQSEIYNGFDVDLHAQFGHGGFLGGGVAIGQTSYNDCAIAKNYPNVTVSQINYIATITSNPTTPTQFCQFTSPWWAGGGQIKVQASYPIPRVGVDASLVYQNLPGYPINTSYVATNAQIAASLGRSLSSGASTETLTNALYAPFSVYEARLNQLDVRLTKPFSIKERFQIKANFDVYNITNANTILADTTTYSTSNTYLRPTSILGARMFKLGTNFTF
jgi:hypothetical protein